MNRQDRLERLQLIYEHLRSIGRIHTQKDLAEAIGTRTESVNAALNGKERYLTDNLFKKIALEYGDIFSRPWLENGEGDMLVENSGNISKNTIVGNNVKGKDINIHNGNDSEAISLLREQLAEKDKEISRLHGIIDKLLKTR